LYPPNDNGFSFVLIVFFCALHPAFFCLLSTPITKAVIQIDVSKGVNIGVDAALKKFSIDIGAVTGFVVSGTLEYNPRENCAIGHKYALDVDNKICSNNFEKIVNSFADCPK
jgi:hypothetical protein